MAKHTPGPWEIENKGDLYSTSARVEVVGVGRDTIALISGLSEEDYANARLIAASPDLLEASKQAATEWRLHRSLTDSCRILEAAIAKAEGE